MGVVAAGCAVGGVVVASAAIAGSPASGSHPRLTEREILRIANRAATAAGDPNPTLIQDSAGPRDRANRVDSGAIVPDSAWSYLIAERGRFVLKNAQIPSGARPPTGTVLTQIVNAATGEITDGGVSDHYPKLARLGPVRTDLRHQPNRAQAPGVPSEPILSPLQRSQIEAAQTATAARDPACSPLASKVPEFSHGTPSPALTSVLGVLRTPANATDRTQISRLPIGIFTGGPSSGPPPPGEGAELEAARRARTALGTTFYIVPASHETGLRPVPARCQAEQRAALSRVLAGPTTATRGQTFRLQRQELAWEAYRGRHTEGIILGTITARARGVDAAASLEEIEHAGLLDPNAGYPGRALISGVVPDGVATVTLAFQAGPLVKSAVVNNVFVIPQPRHGRRLKSVTWRATDGRLIKTLLADTITNG